MTQELKELLTQVVAPKYIEQVLKFVEQEIQLAVNATIIKQSITSDSFKNMAIECDNDEQMAELVRMAEGVGLHIDEIKYGQGLRLFAESAKGHFTNTVNILVSNETRIHFNDFVSQFK